MGKAIRRFEAVLERLRDGLGWTIVRVPFVPGEVWKSMVRLRVKGAVNGFALRSSLFPFQDGSGYFLLVNNTVQRGGGMGLGDLAVVELEPDLERGRLSFLMSWRCCWMRKRGCGSFMTR